MAEPTEGDRQAAIKLFARLGAKPHVEAVVAALAQAREEERRACVAAVENCLPEAPDNRQSDVLWWALSALRARGEGGETDGT